MTTANAAAVKHSQFTSHGRRVNWNIPLPVSTATVRPNLASPFLTNEQRKQLRASFPLKDDDTDFYDHRNYHIKEANE